MRPVRISVAAGAACALSALLASGASALPGGGETEDGYEVEVNVTFTGDGAPDDGGNFTIYVPAQCWWTQMSYDAQTFEFPNREVDVPGVDGTSAEAMLEWYDAYISTFSGSSINVGSYYSVPSREWFEDRVAEEAAGTDLTFYTPACQDGWDQMLELGYAETYEDWFGEVPIILDAWEVTVDPPEPYVDPEDLAIEAREIMEIDEPEVDRNPKIVDGPDQATFVNIPTWFWVTDPETVGDENGQRTIRADIDGSNVWAEVTAETGGLSIASPAGSRHCVPELAKRQWEPGANDADGCTVEFNRASVGHPDGYTVTATTEWEATWEGEDADGNAVGGELDPLTRSATTLVPVAEVQSIVKRVGG